MKDYGYAQSELCWGAQGLMTEAIIRQICEGIRDIGGSRVRIGVQVGTLDDLDMAVNTAVEFGLKPLLCMISNAQFGYNGTPAGYAAQCKMVALRYGPAGTGKVSEYELFNESNSSLNAPGVGDAAGFIPFLKAGYSAIKEVDTSSTVICGGCIPAPDTFIPFIGVATDPIDWYRGIYAAGGKGYFDAAGEHLYFDTSPYPSTTDAQWTYLPGIRAVMDANGDTQKKIWVTEFGVPRRSPDVTSDVQQRDRLKAIVDLLIANTDSLKLGPWFVYNYRSYAGGDGAGNIGMVASDFTHNEPVYSYAKTISEAPSDPLDIVPPTPATEFVVNVTGSKTAQAVWNPATDDVGVSVYQVKNFVDDTVMARTTMVGQTTVTVNNLTPGTPYVAYVTAVDAAGNESVASNTFPFTTNAPSGAQAFFQYDFTGTGSTVPAVFVQLGLGFTVAADIALPNEPSTDGVHLDVAPYTLDQRSPDHSSRIGVSAASTNPYLAASAPVRMSPDGSQFAISMIAGGGQADACKIFTYSGGKLTLRKASNATPLLPGEYLETTVEANVYTATRVRPDGSRADVLSWTDIGGVYPGAVNTRTGLAWWHRKVNGLWYPPPGITGVWKSSDLNATPAPSIGGSELWKLAITKPSRLGLVTATGLWQAGI